MSAKAILKLVILALLVWAILFSGCMALGIQKGTDQTEEFYSQMAVFRPPNPGASSGASIAMSGAGAGVQSIGGDDDWSGAVVANLKTEYPDSVGWLNIPFTGVDYPFAQARNNRYYLDRDLSGDYLAAGTLFTDCDNSADFTDFNTIIYGHHMKDGTMFAGLDAYADVEFFSNHTAGRIFLEEQVLDIEFFAYVITRADDETLYDIPADAKGQKKLLASIRDKARIYEDIGVSTEDRIVTLSTCAYEFKDARLLLIGRL